MLSPIGHGATIEFAAIFRELLFPKLRIERFFRKDRECLDVPDELRLRIEKNAIIKMKREKNSTVKIFYQI